MEAIAALRDCSGTYNPSLMVSGISLANKCQLLFGFAIVCIVGAALSVPWVRAYSLVRNAQIETARQLCDAWLADRTRLGVLEDPATLQELSAAPPSSRQSPRVRFVAVEEVEQYPRGTNDETQMFLSAALRYFRDSPRRAEYMSSARRNGPVVYRYARPMHESNVQAVRERTVTDVKISAERDVAADPLRALLLVERTSQFAEGQLLTTRIFIVAAGIVASSMAGLVFYLILTKLILSPVRKLRATTDKVQSGDLRIRSQIKTGDEFEQLSEAFNSMLDRLEQGQAQLRALNESMDLKLTELAEANVGLYESNRFKSEFLANVSHELRTPLNSIIGFAELLDEIARSETNADPKRIRYIANIINSGRSLLEMINELLDMAKIEAGRMEVSIEPTNVGDLIEGLAGLMRPQAQAKQITMNTQIAQRLPVIETDPGKLQQILYNFLSNAIKFTPEGGTVTISAERVTRQDNSAGVRLAVADTGPGIPYDMQDVIFEKFRQIDASKTRQFAGTGLGLAICRELSQMLGATVSFASEPGRGATFFVDLPLIHQPQAPQPLMAA
jgi:two-component system sensor histidine kinase BarA